LLEGGVETNVLKPAGLTDLELVKLAAQTERLYEKYLDVQTIPTVFHKAKDDYMIRQSSEPMPQEKITHNEYV